MSVCVCVCVSVSVSVSVSVGGGGGRELRMGKEMKVFENITCMVDPGEKKQCTSHKP